MADIKARGHHVEVSLDIGVGDTLVIDDTVVTVTGIDDGDVQVAPTAGMGDVVWSEQQLADAVEGADFFEVIS